MDFIHDKVEMSDFLTEDFDFLVFDFEYRVEFVVEGCEVGDEFF